MEATFFLELKHTGHFTNERERVCVCVCEERRKNIGKNADGWETDCDIVGRQARVSTSVCLPRLHNAKKCLESLEGGVDLQYSSQSASSMTFLLHLPLQ